MKYRLLILFCVSVTVPSLVTGQVRSGTTVDLFHERLDSGGAPQAQDTTVVIEDGSVGSIMAGFADLTVLFAFPTPGEDIMFRPVDISAKVAASQFLTNDLPGTAGGPLSFVGTLAPTSGLAQVGQVDDLVFYTPDVGNNDNDTFFYEVTDVGGLLATGTVQVIVVTDSEIAANSTSVEALGGGQLRITFRGIPNFTYQIQFATELTPVANWIDVGPATANNVGIYDIVHTPPSGGTVFYRAIFQ